MRLFNAKVLDEVLESDGAVAEPNLAWSFLLVRAESLKFTCIVDNVTDPTATCILELVDDAGLVKVLVPGLPIPNTFSSTYSPLDSSYPANRILLPVAVINGSNGPKGHVRLWVCGRGPQALDATTEPPADFATQYRIARAMEDEDRLPPRKRILKPGASSAYSPAIFFPSLKWER